MQISIRLLDDSVHHVVVSRGATVKDVLVAFRRLLSLHADADFSLYLRQKTAEGLDTFACLPDVMSAAEAEALACTSGVCTLHTHAHARVPGVL